MPATFETTKVADLMHVGGYRRLHERYRPSIEAALARGWLLVPGDVSIVTRERMFGSWFFKSLRCWGRPALVAVELPCRPWLFYELPDDVELSDAGHRQLQWLVCAASRDARWASACHPGWGKVYCGGGDVLLLASQ